MFKKYLIRIHYLLFPLKRLKKSGAKIGKNIFWGENVYAELENASLLTIEDNVIVSAYCKFILHDSSLNNITGFEVLYGKIHLKKGSYIGANTTILPGSIVGENSIVGANSLVKGSLKKNSVYLGQPAKYYCSVKELEKKWNRVKKIKNKNIQFKSQVPFSKNKASKG